MLIRPCVLAILLTLVSLASVAEQAPVQWSGETRLDLTEGLSARLVTTQTATDAMPAFQPISELDLSGYHPTGTLLQFRLAVQNATSEPQTLWLYVDDPILNTLTVRYDDKAIEVGESLPFSNRPLALNGYGFVLTFDPGETKTIAGSGTGTLISLPLTLWQPEALMAQTQANGFRDMLFFGTMIALTLFTLLFYSATRVQAYLAFSLFCAFLTLSLSMLFGYAQRFLWPEWPALSSPLAAISLYGMIGFFAWMAPQMIGTRHQPQWLSQSMNWALGLLIGLGLVFLVIGNRPLLMAWPVVWSLVSVFIVTLMLIIELRHGSRRAVRFSIAWSPMIMGMLLLAGSAFGWVTYSQRLISLVLLGVVLSTLLFATMITLYLRESILRRQRLEQETLRFKTEQATELALEVERRTAELTESNRRLNQLALTDPLTGLPNRRHLDDFGDITRRLSAETGKPLLVAILDLDHFKAVNDTLGHDVGDVVLNRLASLLRSESTDTANEARLAGRVGGEEFSMISYGESEAEFEQRLQRLRQTIAGLVIPELDGRGITVSIGWSGVGPSGSISSAFRRADQALYQAKESGRNQVMADRQTEQL
ncbi:MAG TPA: diguanylate cyclase [Saccharospirillum sp.]|nr:diguanylate cyclase [Saccharospirillum sp.]